MDVLLLGSLLLWRYFIYKGCSTSNKSLSQPGYTPEFSKYEGSQSHRLHPDLNSCVYRVQHSSHKKTAPLYKPHCKKGVVGYFFFFFFFCPPSWSSFSLTFIHKGVPFPRNNRVGTSKQSSVCRACRPSRLPLCLGLSQNSMIFKACT